MVDMDAKLRAALTRYRVMAYIVGVMLLILLFVAMPLKYLADSEAVIGVVGPLHGFLYAVYLLATLDVGTKRMWTFRRTVLVMLAGTIPFLSFVVERRVSRDVLGQLASR